MSSHPAARILVIEDDDAVRQMLHRALRTDGYDVTAIADIHEHLDERVRLRCWATRELSGLLRRDADQAIAKLHDTRRRAIRALTRCGA